MPRNGFKTFLDVCHRLCRLFAVYRGPMVAAISASGLTEPDKAKLLAAMNAIDASCAVVDLVRVTFE